MRPIDLDARKLLGFRLAAASSGAKVGAKPDVNVGAKIGIKPSIHAGAKVGAKVGAKPV